MANILIIDDKKLIREKLSAILTKQDHNVVGTAKDGKIGLVLYKELSPELVTLNITMPVMDGIQALKEIRAYDPHANVVICSADNRDLL